MEKKLEGWKRGSSGKTLYREGCGGGLDSNNKYPGRDNENQGTKGNRNYFVAHIKKVKSVANKDLGRGRGKMTKFVVL